MLIEVHTKETVLGNPVSYNRREKRTNYSQGKDLDGTSFMEVFKDFRNICNYLIQRVVERDVLLCLLSRQIQPPLSVSLSLPSIRPLLGWESWGVVGLWSGSGESVETFWRSYVKVLVVSQDWMEEANRINSETEYQWSMSRTVNLHELFNN